MDGGMVGGIVGSVIGVMGGVVGTAASIINTKGPREQAMAVRLAALGWLWMTAIALGLFLIPRPWKQAALLGMIPWFLAIPWANRLLAQARAEDRSGS